MTSLFDPIRLGQIQAPNRMFMAPLTRGRGTRAHVPTPLMADYYRQRASAGLIISEAIGISQQGLGWAYATGLWNQEQVDGWASVVEAVHAEGGRIVAQLWHMGRIVHPSFLDGGQSVSASATTAPGFAHTYAGKQPHAQARALEVDEIPAILDDYRKAARNALAAGFDGVQIHAANGYLIDQFLRAAANHRTDAYGGSIENRMRLLVQVVEAVAGAIGADRTGVRLSPNGDSQGVTDPDPVPLFRAAATELGRIGIAFLELREPGPDGTRGKPDHPPVHPAIRQAFTGPLVLNSDYDGPKAQAALDRGEADAIAFGRGFLANPDLPDRIRHGLPLAPDDMETWYTQGPEGYTDYPRAAPVHADAAAG
ncbi:alkene reductase [Geminicoccus roseus]|uniref:alkene reductase n=1 Tax=Geminicoccus roseus TaxID=404900 RepID=UPI000414F108|nr:alkene reductase [Geminicoccus roseus]